MKLCARLARKPAVLAGFALGIVVTAAVGSPAVATATDLDAATTPPAAALTPLSAQPAVPAQYADLAKELQKQFPGTPIESIRESGVSGVVEVVLGGHRILYSDLTGKHAFNGHLFELETHEDLTARHLAELTRVDSSQLPLADAFDVVHGNGKREVSLFSDPDCPYCKKLEEQLSQVNDVTIHVFLYPLASLHPRAYEHALGIWCSKDRQRAWADKMLKGLEPATATCDNPIARNLALGTKLHVSGTPTLVFPDGRVHPGITTAQELDHLLSTQ